MASPLPEGSSMDPTKDALNPVTMGTEIAAQDPKYCIEQLATGAPRPQEKQEELDNISEKSFGSINSRASSASFASSSKRAAADAAALKARMASLERCQNIERELEELLRRQRELRRLEEQEILQGEIDAAEAIEKALRETKQ